MTETYPDWIPAFQPVANLGKGFREGQAQFGQAVFTAFKSNTHLMCEAPVGTGKSFAFLVPMIKTILAAKQEGKSLKGVVSTETLALQSQLYFTDLPFLEKLYPGLDWKILRGRSHYFCLDQAKISSLANRKLSSIVSKLESRLDSLVTGEKFMAERILGFELSKEEWDQLTGSTAFCNDNDCKSDKGCFAAKARSAALTADIVVVNHALLQTDSDMKQGGGTFVDGILGPIDLLVVDEAHALHDILVDAWTEKLSEWELQDMHGSIAKGVDKAKGITPHSRISEHVETANEDVQDVISNFIRFYGQLCVKNGEDWIGSSTAVSEKYLVGQLTPALLNAMDEYETQTPARLTYSTTLLKAVEEYLTTTLATARDNELKGLREISKGLRATKKLLRLIDILSRALQTKNGIVFDFGVNYGVIVDGWKKRDESHTCTIRMIPLDVSGKAKAIWAQTKSSVLCSGTLTDPISNSYRFTQVSLGFPESRELSVSTPFDFHANQRVYITPAERRPEEGTQFSMTELIDLVNAADGRTLVLCTSRRELDIVAEKLKSMYAMGTFPYPVLVQEKDSDKQKLVERFTREEHSVLLGLKSFFVGISVEGSSLSQVLFIRFPLPRYSVECRMQIEVWRQRGFPGWYQMKALEGFKQGSGRLIRSVTDRGVIGILDQRVMDKTQNVFKTAQIGVAALGSPIIQTVDAARQFLTSA